MYRDAKIGLTLCTAKTKKTVKYLKTDFVLFIYLFIFAVQYFDLLAFTS